MKTQKQLCLFDRSSRKNPDGTNARGFFLVSETEVLLKRPLPKITLLKQLKSVALTETCKLKNKKIVNIYTDSQYVFSTVHVFAQQWKNRYVDIHS